MFTLKLASNLLDRQLLCYTIDDISYKHSSFFQLYMSRNY